MSGRTIEGPCGHPHVAVIGQFYQCTIKGCTGAEGSKCRKCNLGPMEPFRAPTVPDGTLACRACGHLWWAY